MAFGEHLHGGQQMVMSLLNNLGVVRRDDTGSKEVFQEVPSCCSALAKAPALSIISSAEPLMTGDPLHDGSAAFNIVWQMKLLALQYMSKKLPFLQKKPLHTTDLVKIINYLHGCMK